MKPSEILQSYENAQYKTKQIGVLAELNACSKDEITDILKEMGAELPKRKYQKKEEPAKEPEKRNGRCTKREWMTGIHIARLRVAARHRAKEKRKPQRRNDHGNGSG